jgi:hypothetical protein
MGSRVLITAGWYDMGENQYTHYYVAFQNIMSQENYELNVASK